ncbi:hypothetical protein HAX54_014156 [Datura stramonium]|uniref:Uncharacterized protein n=1 Tax=Datura stramonium TaxID=4076 RepID=A0ABS8TNK7_DATST|nr:hypothetical protein [Datura stramonium]
MASSSIACVQFSTKKSPAIPSNFLGTKVSSCAAQKIKKQRSLKVVAAVGDVSADGTTYLVAGAAAVALLGTAFPILFSRKDLYYSFLHFALTFPFSNLFFMFNHLHCPN